MVGFRKRQRNLLKEFEESRKAVSLQGCKIKRGKYSNNLEVMLRSESNVTCSSKKIKVDPERLSG